MQKSAAHLVQRGHGWYWVRRYPAALRGTVAKADRAQIRLSLKTRDVRTARSIGLQLDAALDRVIAFVTSAPLSVELTSSALASLLRQTVVDAHERQRADRDADLPRPRSKPAGVSIPQDLLEAVQQHADAAEAALSAGHIAEIGELVVDVALVERLESAVSQVGFAKGSVIETAAAEDRAAAYRGRAGLITRDLRRNDLTVALACLDKMLASEKILLNADELRVSAREAMRALVAVAEEDARREDGVYQPAPFNVPAVPAKAELPLSSQATPLQRSPGTEQEAEVSAAQTPPSPFTPISKLIEPYLATCGEGEKPKSSHTIGQDRRSLELFVEICGDRPMANYNRRDVTKFLATLRKLPTNHGKSPKDKDLSIEDLIARADTTNSPRISDKTVKRHWSALGQLFRYGADIGETTIGAKRDMLDEHGFAMGNPQDDREVWSTDDLLALFASPVWNGCHPFFRSRPGESIIRDAKFWLPLMAPYHGNRLEEFADLRRKDIVQVDGVVGINITDDHRRLKTNRAKRLIPLHPELIRIGFLNYVNALPADPEGPVFPDLDPQGADKKRGPAFTKWFGEYRKETGIYKDDVAYHSFRHLARTRIASHVKTRADVRVQNYIFGWEFGKTEGDKRYDKGPPISECLPLIESISYPELDFKHLYVDEPARVLEFLSK